MWLKPHLEIPFLLNRVTYSNEQNTFNVHKMTEEEYQDALTSRITNSKRIRKKDEELAKLNAYRLWMMNGIIPTSPDGRRSARIKNQKIKEENSPENSPEQDHVSSSNVKYDFRTQHARHVRPKALPHFDWGGMVFVDERNTPEMFAVKLIARGIRFSQATLQETNGSICLRVLGSACNGAFFAESVTFSFTLCCPHVVSY